jgi:hypothetical protein
MLGEPDELRAWTIPVSSLRNGYNELHLTVVSGTTVNLVFADVSCTIA